MPSVVSLQVACDGFVVSDSVAFEYRRIPTIEPSPEKALLDRLADVESRLQGPGLPSPAAHLEERLVAYCQVIIHYTVIFFFLLPHKLKDKRNKQN